jgi:glycosyltransferase involved in cell wall biosynthesis
MRYRYEIILVDDGSSDSTFARARELSNEDRRIRVIKFRRNYGQTPAMAAGIDQASGRYLVTLDGDLQNDPEDIPKLLSTLEEGFDIVVGWRYKRQDKLLTRKIPSVIANWLIGKITGVPIKDNGCSLKAYRAEVMKEVPLYSEMHRFIPALVSVTGARIAQIKVRHHARRFGVSKYGLGRIYRVISDLLAIKTIVSFANRSLLWFSMLSLPFLILGGWTISYSAYRYLSSTEAVPLVLLGVGVLFVALALFLFLCGILSELLYKTGDIDIGGLALLTATVSRPDTENASAGAAPQRETASP